MSRKIVGVFETEEQAIGAIEALKEQGYTEDDISIVAKDRKETAAVEEQTGTKGAKGLAAGAVTGGVIGGAAGLFASVGSLAIPGIGPLLAAGAITATLTGAAIGASAGGFVGSLVGLGISEDEAKAYDDYVRGGMMLVLVETDEARQEGVYDAFRRNGTLNSDTYLPAAER
ncbi:hypothetical protein J31TS4_45600 [Paenibacillus sp. J31TS4]|uniref:general stress protein n=1 Tax=Paenibacillus sp. J31TS4 TaxID=2807195 RepID=UPI001B2EB2A8|nr:general stress protein [Paenibacillus sp. J31TS4]GIP41280.1 hypothetical protein J31TS4_45600 [Paenibacillus sp. J31TS4]